jgi:hypothetical protein
VKINISKENGGISPAYPIKYVTCTVMEISCCTGSIGVDAAPASADATLESYVGK